MAPYDSDDASDDAIDHPPSEGDLDESGSDEPGSSSETGDDAGGLLDIEASESDGDDSEESDEESLLDGTRAISFWDGVDFPQFPRLPPEIREFVWRFFFESTLERPRILEFQVTKADSYGWYPTPTNGLEAQMLPILAAMRVNSESRAIALRSFPDKLLFGGELGGYAVPFDKETDIVAITFATLDPGCLHAFLHPDREQSLFNINFSIPGFTDQIKRLVISSDELAGTTKLAGADCTGPWAFLASFTYLEVIYEKHDGAFEALRLDYTLPHAIRDVGITELDEVGIPHRYHRYLVWPDRPWREQQKGTMEIKLLEDLALDFEAMNGDMWDLVGEKLRGVEVWPMMEFAGSYGYRAMVKFGFADFGDLPTSPAGRADADSLEGEDDSDTDGDNDDEEEDDSEMDDFIDDGPVADFEGTSDILDHDDVADAAFDGEDDVFGGFSPIDQGSDGGVGQGSGQESLRPAKRRQARQIISDDEDHDEDEENFGMANGQKSRQIISDDEDDDADADARPAKKVKTPLVIVSTDSERDTSATDSESDEEDAPRKRRGRPRVPDSESESDEAAPVNSHKRKRGIPAVTLSDSEDEEAADAAPINPPKRKRAAPAVIVTDSENDSDDEAGKVEITDSGSSEEDDEDDDEADGRAGRPLTLAEKLGMHRRANPIGLSSEDEESSVDMPQTDRGYGHSYDEEDDEEDEENGNDRYDGYPEDSGSEDEDDAY